MIVQYPINATKTDYFIDGFEFSDSTERTRFFRDISTLIIVSARPSRLHCPHGFQIAIPVSRIFLKKGSGAKRDSGR
jgi:hypothetical protein